MLEAHVRLPLSKNDIFEEENGKSYKQDFTGRVSSNPAEVFCDPRSENGIIAFFDNSLSHSLWRAQELMLFSPNNIALEKPILDFGCGDGEFSSCIFSHLDFGIDVDQAALIAASDKGIYGDLKHFNYAKTEIKDSTIKSVMSVSVLEHTENLDECLEEISRVLEPNGTFVFSVPNRNFTAQLEKLINTNFAEYTNKKMHHRNLLDKEKWIAKLEAAGFTQIEINSFQSLDFTKKYFALSLLGKRGIGRSKILRKFFFASMHKQLIALAKASIEPQINDSGCNYFIKCKKEDATKR